MFPLCSNIQHRMSGWYSKVIFLYPSSGHIMSFCNWETFNATCQQGEVVMVTTARYGRMRRGRCIHSTSTHAIGCSEDILRFDWSIFFHPSTGSLLRDYCNWETFQASCDQGHVIMMTSAKYGRMRLGRCFHETSSKIVGCQDDIIK